MLIKLTFAHNRMEFWMRADHVRSIERSADNPLVTAVGTTLMTSTGPIVYAVLETPDEIAEEVNRIFQVIRTH